MTTMTGPVMRLAATHSLVCLAVLLALGGCGSNSRGSSAEFVESESDSLTEAGSETVVGGESDVEGESESGVGMTAAGSVGTRQGRFLDSAVSGMAYSTPTENGMTEANGEFRYRDGEFITFSIGDVTLPTVAATGTMTALDLFSTRDTNTRRVVNLNRLLQTLDVDGDASNGIVIDAAAGQAASGLTIDFAAPGFDAAVVNLVANANANQTALVGAPDATTHFLDTLDANGISVSDCTAVHPAVGRTVPLVGTAHGVTGTVTVLDDCTLDVRTFGYDGGGPDVAFYAGKGRRYGVGSVRLSPALDGRDYVDDTLRLSLPAGTTFDDVDSLSVWCFDFNVSFGDAFFGIP